MIWSGLFPYQLEVWNFTPLRLGNRGIKFKSMVGNSFSLPNSWTKTVRCCSGIILWESIDQKGLQFDSRSSHTIILDNQAGDCYNIITNGENQRQLINSLASGGQNCHEICHGWICDIWCPNGRGFILNHNNRNPLQFSFIFTFAIITMIILNVFSES